MDKKIMVVSDNPFAKVGAGILRANGTPAVAATERPRASDYSAFYTLEELTQTSHGPNPIMGCTRYGVGVSEDEIKNNLRALCADVLDPLCKIYGKTPLSSCYRGPLINAAVGGSNNSAHTAGLAADTQPAQGAAVVAFFAKNWKEAHLDRIIFEERGPKKWLHLQRQQRGAPAKEPSQALFFISPTADRYDRVSVEALIGHLLSMSRKVEVPK
jgi:hypothetical protein